MGYPIKQSQTAQPLLFLMIDSTDHISGKTGLSPTVTLSKNGGAFAAPAGAVTEIGSGWYKVAGNATDTATLGPLLLHATGAGADPCDGRFDVVAYDPQSATNLGLSNLDAAVSSRSTYAGTDTSGTTTLLSRLTSTRATNLDNLDATVSSRLATSGYAAPPTVVQIRQEMDANSTKLANLDAAISTRSTYAGADTSGTTALLSRLTAQRATNMDNLDAAVSTISTGGLSAADIADAIYDSVAVNTTTFREVLRAMSAVSCGNLTESADHTDSSFADINDPSTPRVTSVNTATTRTVTIL